MQAPTLKLTYFNLPGRGERVRLLLHAVGATFEDNRIEFPAFGAVCDFLVDPIPSVLDLRLTLSLSLFPLSL